MIFTVAFILGLMTAGFAVVALLLFSIERTLHKMALSQADFDTKLSGLQTSVAALLALPSAPPADLTSEGAIVDDLKAQVDAKVAAAPAP